MKFKIDSRSKRIIVMNKDGTCKNMEVKILIDEDIELSFDNITDLESTQLEFDNTVPLLFTFFTRKRGLTEWFFFEYQISNPLLLHFVKYTEGKITAIIDNFINLLGGAENDRI